MGHCICNFNLVRLCVVILNNRGKRSVHQIHINEQIPIKGTQFSTYIIEIKNIYTYKLAKYICKICNQMLPKEITEEREYESNYRNFHTRQLDNKILIIRLCKSIKQQPHFVYRASKLRNAIQKDLSNRPYFYKILQTADLSNIVFITSFFYICVSFKLGSCRICL